MRPIVRSCARRAPLMLRTQATRSTTLPVMQASYDPCGHARRCMTLSEYVPLSLRYVAKLTRGAWLCPLGGTYCVGLSSCW
jgi:hypothetical protein